MRPTAKNEDNLKNGEDLKNEDNLKMMTNSRIKKTTKMNTICKYFFLDEPNSKCHKLWEKFIIFSTLPHP